MADYGALAENTRRNERVERGSITFTGTATIGFTASQTVNLTPAYGRLGGMRAITHFYLQLDDGGAVLSGIVGASTAVVTGSLNAAGTILTLHANAFTSSANPTLIAATTACTVHYQVWGNLLGVPGETGVAGF